MIGSWNRRAVGLAIVALIATLPATLAIGSFGRGGKVTLAIGNGTPDRVVADNRGGLLLLGRYFEEQTVVRIKSNGAIDRRFGDRGMVSTTATDMVVGGGGRIVLIGTAEANTEPRYSHVTVTRLLRDGSPDPTFGRRGTAAIEFGGPRDEGSTLAFAPGGKMWIGGSRRSFEESRGAGSSEVFVGRLRPDGKLDSSFSGDGLRALQGFIGVEALASVAHGGLLVAGGSEVARIRRGGAIDTSFGDEGRVRVQLSPPPQEFRYFGSVGRIGLLPNGGFLLVGTSNDQTLKTNNDLGIALRFRADGEMDRSYGSNGLAIFKFRGTDFTFPASFVVTGRGRAIVAAGLIDPSNEAHRFGAIALRPDGAIDRSFGNRGEVWTTFSGNSWARDIAFWPRHRIVISGWSQPGGGNRTDLAELSLKGQRVR